MPQHAAPSLLPALTHHLSLPPAQGVFSTLANRTANRRVLLSLAAPVCAPDDSEYAISTGLSIGMGMSDVVLDDSVVPLLPRGASVEVVGGVDFGEAELLPEAVVPSCGRLCRGCIGDYLANKQAYEAAAYPESADAQHDQEERQQLVMAAGGSGGLPATTIAILALSFALTLALLTLAWVMSRRLKKGYATADGARSAGHARFRRLLSKILRPQVWNAFSPTSREESDLPPPPPPPPPPPSGPGMLMSHGLTAGSRLSLGGGATPRPLVHNCDRPPPPTPYGAPSHLAAGRQQASSLCSERL